MKLNRFASLIALMLVAALATTASADRSHWVEKPLKLQKTATSAAVDSLTINGAADTCRTADIDMGDWDVVNGVAAGYATAHNGPAAFISLKVWPNVGGTAISSADTIYWTIEKKIAGTYQFNGTGGLAVTTGLYALQQGAGTMVGSTFCGPLFFLNDFVFPTAANLGGCKTFRLRIGRSSCASPYQIKASIIYQKQADTY